MRVRDPGTRRTARPDPSDKPDGIGALARRAGVAPSAIRHHEGVGLLPAPPRAGGRPAGPRRYDATVLDGRALIAPSRSAGFTVAETKALVTGFAAGVPPADRWRALATRELAELAALVARAARMRAVLRQALTCGCVRLEDCGHRLAAACGPADTAVLR
jgi:MerR family redox-sensitive transcriptional activator SoxR